MFALAFDLVDSLAPGCRNNSGYVIGLGGISTLKEPTDLRKPECPYCHLALKKIPGAKTKCPHCARSIFVRTRPEDFSRVLVTRAEAERIDTDYRNGRTTERLTNQAHKYYPDVADWAAILRERDSKSHQRTHPVTGNTIRSTIVSTPEPRGFFRFDAINRVAVEYARERAAEMIGKTWMNGVLIDNPDPRWSITDSTRMWLRDGIRLAFEDGMSPAELANLIMGTGRFSKYAAKLIAFTEIAFINIRTHAATAVKSGATHKRSFLSADNDDDDFCDAAAAAGEVDIDFDYGNGLLWPLFHLGCRCTVSFYCLKERLS